jgi:hypothetical protein
MTSLKSEADRNFLTAQARRITDAQKNLPEQRMSYYSLVNREEPNQVRDTSLHAVSWFNELRKDVMQQTKSHNYGPYKTSELKWRNIIDPQ